MLAVMTTVLSRRRSGRWRRPWSRAALQQRPSSRDRWPKFPFLLADILVTAHHTFCTSLTQVDIMRYNAICMTPSIWDFQVADWIDLTAGRYGFEYYHVNNITVNNVKITVVIVNNVKIKMLHLIVS